MTVTLKFQSSGTIPGDGRPARMQGGSMTVGRGPANDLVLPDPEKMLSKNHFVIEDHNGNIVIVDLSTNGTFLNYSKIPLGRTPTPLNSGDVLVLGSYELVVEIREDIPDDEDLIPAPAAQDDVSHGAAENAPDPYALTDEAGPEGDFLDDLLGDKADPEGPGQFNIPDPIDELASPLDEDDGPLPGDPPGEEASADSSMLHGSSTADSYKASPASSGNMIPDDWDDLLEPQPGEDAPPGSAAPAPAEPPGVPEAPPPDPPAPEPEQPAAPEAPAAMPTGGAGDQSAARAFLDALDVEDLKISDEDLIPTMTRMGRVMRGMIAGLREVLMTRTSIKSEFRMDQTMIGAAGNNPLKFSVSPDQAVEALVRARTKGYLDAEAATQEALDDIKAHEVAMVTGMEAALKGVLQRLDPEKLAGEIESSGKLGNLFKGRKARYWEVYESMYAQISDQAENDFHELFSREFARAYKEQLDKLK